MNHSHYTRRKFIGTAALGAVAWFSGFPRRFAWAVSNPMDQSLKLVFYTDVHARTEWDTPVAMTMAAHAINALNPDLVLAGGDLITDGFQSSAKTVAPRWDAYMAMQKSIEAPLYAAIGNHDLVAAIPEDGTEPSLDPRAVFREKMGIANTYRSFDLNGYHVVLLDSIEVTGGELKYEGKISPEQLAWLEQDLSGLDQDTPIVLLTHIPLLTGFYQATRGATAPAPRNRVMVNNREVLHLFEGYNLLLVLQGHLHVDEMLKWRNVMFITGGAICGKWWRGAWHGTEPGFGVVTLNRDRVDWEYISYGWIPRRPENA